MQTCNFMSNNTSWSAYKALAITIPALILLMPAGAILASAQLSPMQSAGGNTTQTVTPNNNATNTGNATAASASLCAPNSTATAGSNTTTALSNSTSSTFSGEKIYSSTTNASSTGNNTTTAGNASGVNAAMTQSLDLARMHLQEGCNALNNSDTQGAFVHFGALEKALNDIQGNLTSSNATGTAAANMSAANNATNSTGSSNATASNQTDSNPLNQLGKLFGFKK